VLFGAVQIGVGLLGPRLDGSVVSAVLAIAGFSTGIVLGLFLLGTLANQVSERAALCGVSFGLPLMVGVAFGTRLAWPWYSLVGSLATLGIGLLADRVLTRRS
jgi:hypothetical protein